MQNPRSRSLERDSQILKESKGSCTSDRGIKRKERLIRCSQNGTPPRQQLTEHRPKKSLQDHIPPANDIAQLTTKKPKSAGDFEKSPALRLNINIISLDVEAVQGDRRHRHQVDHRRQEGRPLHRVDRDRRLGLLHHQVRQGHLVLQDRHEVEQSHQ
jgi:hypothetical protein